MNVLLTGGCGYIGSHILLDLIEHGHNVIVVDNLCNSNEDNLRTIENITKVKVKFYKIDLRDNKELEKIFKLNKIDIVIHLAGLKNNPISVKYPIEYYENNVLGSINLIKTMINNGVSNVIFSSSATVYSEKQIMPLQETSAISPKTPYGDSKIFVEKILESISKSNPNWKTVILRYFNPAGAHKSGLIKESTEYESPNLMSQILHYANKKKEHLKVYGNDYQTRDGTGVRDYIHICDLSKGHLLAIDRLFDTDFKDGFIVLNLGSGNGYSVNEMISTFEKVNSAKINVKIVSRRDGDIAESYTDNSLAKSFLNWSTTETLETICEDSWRSFKNKLKV